MADAHTPAPPDAPQGADDSTRLPADVAQPAATPSRADDARSGVPAGKLPADESGVPPSEERPAEFGGQKGPEPTRYGDWEKNGRCTDF